MSLTLRGGTIEAPMGCTIIGGLLVSTLLTLIVAPVLYSLFTPGPGSPDKYRTRSAQRSCCMHPARGPCPGGGLPSGTLLTYHIVKPLKFSAIKFFKHLPTLFVGKLITIAGLFALIGACVIVFAILEAFAEFARLTGTVIVGALFRLALDIVAGASVAVAA